MRSWAAFAVSLALVISFNLFATPAAAGAGPLRAVIVVLRDDADSDSVATEHAQRFGALVSHVYGAALRGYAARVPERLITMLQGDPRVAFVEEDRLLWATDFIPNTGVYRIDAEQSPTFKATLPGPPVTTGVAIIDTGIISNHPALNVQGGYNCTGFNRKAWTDGNGHGTHVAGTVAAKYMDPPGIVGVAPGAPLWAVRVLASNGSGFLSWIVCGINWVANNASANKIKVANMSLGGSGADDGNCGTKNNDSMHKAICNAVTKGVTFVAAAGNDAKDFKTFTPAAYDEVLTVTAMADYDGLPGAAYTGATCGGNPDDTAAGFSNWTTPASTLGSDETHTIAAPGVCVTSTYLNNLNNGYATGSGTSFASPHVAGTVALCISSGKCTGAPADVIQTLRTDADPNSPNPKVTPYYGFKGDPNSPVPGRYYGYLVYAGGY
ncbi:MAG: S8 family serine peptidase [Chloroflexota bacterium]